MKKTLLALIFLAATTSLFAQDYPSKPIRMVVNFPPGGGVDLIGRLVGNALSPRIGQPVVIDNRPGSGGAVGAALVAKAAPDGYTVLVTSNGAITQIPNFTSQPYDPAKELAPLVKANNVPTSVFVSGASQFKSLKELLEHARANPGKVSWGTPGTGSSMHIELEILKERFGLDITHIPYKGAAPIMADAMGGQLTVGAPGLPPTIGNIKSGKLRLLAVWGANRVSVFPDVPTVKEASGAAELEGFPTWYGFMLPAGVPKDVAAKLEAYMVAAVRDPEVVRKMADAGAETVAQSGAAFGAANQAESAAFARVVKKLNIQPD